MRLTLTALFLASQATYAQTPAPRVYKTHPEAVIQAYTAQVTRMLKPRVFTLGRELMTFHYENPPGTDAYRYESPTDLRGHVASVAERFFDYGLADGNTVGPGEYVALDPASSATFGGFENPQLFVIPLAKAARLVDVRELLPNAQMNTLRYALQEFECLEADQDLIQGLGETIQLFRGSQNPVCRKIVIDAFKALQIHGIFYDYDGSDSVAGCRDRDFAINVISPAGVRMDQLALFGNDERVESVPLASAIARLLSESKNEFTVNYQVIDEVRAGPIFPRSLSAVAPIDGATYARWKNARIYGCGPIWANEDANSATVAQFKKRVIGSDSEIENLMLEMRRALFSRADDIRAATGTSNLQYSLSSMNAMERTLFHILGLTSYDQFLKAKDMASDAMGSQDVRYRALSTLFGEPIGSTPLRLDLISYSSITHELLRSKTPGRGVVMSVLKKVGLGPRLSRIILNDMLETQGGVPDLTPAAARDVNQSDARVQRANRERYKQILLTCAQLYRGKTPIKDIMSGPCGIRQKAPQS